MDNKKVSNDILKEWFEIRQDIFGNNVNDEEKEHEILLDQFAERILRNVPKKNKKYVKKQIDLIDENFLDYISYWNEKFYRTGFGDGVKIISSCLFNK